MSWQEIFERINYVLYEMVLFREHDVEIPFPQRDLHLRSSDVALG